MKTILIHGLGQNASAWNYTVECFKEKKDVVCPNLFKLVEGELNYNNLYSAFSRYLSEFAEPVNLCGLSLGAILALNYAMDFPDKVHSLVLIGAQYKIPKKTMKMQNMVFKLMPKSLFLDMGIEKKDCIGLTESMADLDFSDRLNSVVCPTLIICGEKDTANKVAAVELEEKIDGSVLKTVEGAGHEVNVMAPEILAEILEDFYGKGIL